MTPITLRCFQELIYSCIPLPNFVEDLLPARCFPSGVGKHFLDFNYLRLCGPHAVFVASPPLSSSTTFQNVRTIISSQSYRSRLRVWFDLWPLFADLYSASSLSEEAQFWVTHFFKSTVGLLGACPYSPTVSNQDGTQRDPVKT